MFDYNTLSIFTEEKITSIKGLFNLAKRGQLSCNGWEKKPNKLKLEMKHFM